MEREDLEQLQRVTDDVGQVVLLEMSSPNFTGTMRIANDTREHSFAGNTFIPVGFGFKLPDQKQGGTGRAQLVIDNVGRGITEELERVMPEDIVMAKIIVCSKTSPLREQYTSYLPVTNVSIKDGLATADCGIDFVTRQKAVKLRANPHTTPGIF